MKAKCTKVKGTANHERWPKGREEDILRFFAKHALSAEPDAPAAAEPGDSPAPAP